MNWVFAALSGGSVIGTNTLCFHYRRSLLSSGAVMRGNYERADFWLADSKICSNSTVAICNSEFVVQLVLRQINNERSLSFRQSVRLCTILHR